MKFNKSTLFAGLFFTLISFTATSQVNPETIFSDVDDTEQYDVLALAKMDSNLSTFVKLAEMSGLSASMDLAGSYTIFIPTNDAFGELSKEKYSELMKPENKVMMIKTLKRHILPNKVYSSAFNDSQIIDTNGDENIAVGKSDIGSTIYIGGAQIIKADVEASNGVIHIVDRIVEANSDVLN
jgi:uncharacterized surface protein with fasciclin (FAS1) repeats